MGAQASALVAKPPGRRTVQSRPDWRTASSNEAGVRVGGGPGPGALGGEQDHAPDPAGPRDLQDPARLLASDEQEQRLGPVEGGLQALRLGQVGPLIPDARPGARARAGQRRRCRAA